MLLLALLSLVAPSKCLRAAEPRELWLYYPTNLLPDESIAKARPIWTRAGKAGYTHVLLADSKFARLGEMDNRYFDHAEQIKKLAAELKLTLVPALFSVGYSNDLLSNDPNLAEGLPVRDQLFVVGNDGVATVEADPKVSLDTIAFKDPVVSISGNVATFTPADGNARMRFKLKVAPDRCYHVAVSIRTRDYKPQPEIKALAGERSLQWQNLGVKPTQDWTEHHVVFNSLDHNEVNLYFGVWGHSPTGSLEMKDWRIEESPLVNLLRRPGAPLVIKSEGGPALVEGKDFEKLTDPKMGSVPWKGEYDSWHQPPILKTHLKPASRLRVSWYHPAIVYDGQVSACISEPAIMRLLADQSSRVKKLFDAPGYMMSHDEFRTLGWDESCRGSHHTPGELLAANVRQCSELLKPARAYVWNDMFDPFHNAVPGPYYLVNGPWTGSWEGLGKQVAIVNWNYGKRNESLKFFADRGHQQIIAGYYDGGQDTRAWVESAARVKSVIGFMYTTWRSDYSQLAQFAHECREGAER
jgi:hypothetical protein